MSSALALGVLKAGWFGVLRSRPAAPSRPPSAPVLGSSIPRSLVRSYYVYYDEWVEYQGVPISGLRIEALEWSEERAEHIRTRTKRYGPGEVDIEPEWATEAAMDPDRLAGPAGTGQSLQVVGWSESCRRILKVWLLPKDLEAGEWYGASACEANSTNQRHYREMKGGMS